jgi:hypothetical protein
VFTLPTAGTYRVTFQATVDEAGGVELMLNGIPLAYTGVGRDTASTQIIGRDLITAPAGSVLALIAAPGNVAPLTVPPNSSPTNQTSTTIVIEQIF